MIKLFVVLVMLVLVIFDPATGFRLNDYQEEFDTGDHTVASIIRDGILKAIVEHRAKKNPALGAPPTHLTEKSVLQWIYGERVPTEKLAGAIDDIITSAMLTGGDPNWRSLLFSEEGIHKGHQMLQNLHKSIVDKLSRSNGSDSDSTGTRALIGKTLCGIILFYSSTNWVPTFVGDMSIRTYRILGQPEKDIEYFVAPPDFPTCITCIGGGSRRCENNLALLAGRGIFTSFYRDPFLPQSDTIGASNEGKCGERYSSGDTLVNGGIGKSSRNPSRSPHWFYHDPAGKIAIKAVVEFFIDVEIGIFPNGATAFDEVMGLQRDREVVFVIDTTGSMGQEIKAVREQTIRLAEKLAGSPDAPKTYTIVEFNDPVVKPAFTTPNVETFVKHIDNINVNGGGDCPEMALTGMLKGLDAVKHRSTMFMFTDAPAKDSIKESAVITNARAKGVSIIIFVAASTGCGMNAPANRALYQRIAEQTGGQLYFSLSDADFNKQLSLIEEGTRGGLSTILSQNVTKSGTLTFNVDINVKSLLVVISSGVKITQSVKLMNSTGDVATPTLVTQTLIVFQVEVAIYGSWSLVIQGSPSATFSLSVLVSGETGSTVSFELYEDAGDGTVKPVTGTPDPGTKVTVRINFHSTDEISALHFIRLISASSAIIANYTAYLKGDGTGVATIVYPSEAFTIEVEAVDKAGNPVKRVDTTVRLPAEVTVTTNNASVSLMTNHTMVITLRVHSRGNMSRTYSVDVEDKDGIVADIHNLTGHLPPHGVDYIRVTLSASEKPGYSTPTFTVITSDGARASKRLSVVITDPPPPTVVAPEPTTAFPSGADKARIDATVVTFVLICVAMVMATIQ